MKMCEWQGCDAKPRCGYPYCPNHMEEHRHRMAYALMPARVVTRPMETEPRTRG